MDQSGLPDAVKRFILLSIPSVPYLEALLIMRNHPGQSWDAAKMSPQLYLNQSAAQSLLDALHENGVVSQENGTGQFRYQPNTPELASIIDALAKAYPQYLIEVTHLIHAKLSKKAHKFANAFIWEQEK